MDLSSDLKKAKRGAIAKAISIVENDEKESRKLIKKIFKKSGKSVIIGITGSHGVLGSILIKILYKYKIVRFTGDICKTKDIIKWLTNNNLSAIIHLAAIVPVDKVNQNKV